IVLACGNGRPIYVHYPADDQVGLDSCSLPMSTEELGHAVDEGFLSFLFEKYGSNGVLRLHADELISRHRLPLQRVNYELQRPLADAGIRSSRDDLDKKIVYRSFDELPYTDMEESISTLQYLTDSILRQALCSMNRIVISFMHPAHNDLLITTSRDTEKRTITLDDLMFCDLREGGADQIIVYRSGDRKITSGIQALIAYHAVHTQDILLHVHLLFPVLLDEDFKACYFTRNSPRTIAFGLELSKAFSDGHTFVLRKQEGIWCRGLTAEAVIDAMLNCQQKALQGLQSVMAGVNG
ncbi:MAG: hypothetical protein WCF67_25325, partial [Chitinophagaceae bacterium]